jgi:hypothetical protein
MKPGYAPHCGAKRPAGTREALPGTLTELNEDFRFLRGRANPACKTLRNSQALDYAP